MFAHADDGTNLDRGRAGSSFASMRTIADWRRARAYRRARRAEMSTGDGWLEYRRRRRADERALRAGRRAEGRTGHFGQSDKGLAQVFVAGSYFKKGRPR
jgi:hypothetical protein